MGVSPCFRRAVIAPAIGSTSKPFGSELRAELMAVELTGKMPVPLNQTIFWVGELGSLDDFAFDDLGVPARTSLRGDPGSRCGLPPGNLEAEALSGGVYHDV